MKATTPEIVAAADAAMHCKDWLYLNLTGVRATDPSEASSPSAIFASAPTTSR